MSFFQLAAKKKSYFCVILVGQLTFDCRVYCGLSRRMQGGNAIFQHSPRDISSKNKSESSIKSHVIAVRTADIAEIFLT